MKRHIIILISFLLIFASCEKKSVSDFDNLLVLEGYLFQDEKVDSIRLSKCLSFASEDTVYTPVNDAEVFIIWNNIRYLLVNCDSGYYNYNGNDLLIQEGDKYSIEVLYNGQITTSTTVVPQKTSINTLTDNVLTIDTVFTFVPPQFNITDQEEGLEISWNNPDNRYFYIVVESADSASASIEMGEGDGRFGGMRPPQNMIFRFRSEPFIGDSYFINSRMLEKYGKHVVKVYSVNEEYANLYENRSQDSRNLSEPVTNVQNGLGIFTAFSYVEEVFYVKNLYRDR